MGLLDLFRKKPRVQERADGRAETRDFVEEAKAAAEAAPGDARALTRYAIALKDAGDLNSAADVFKTVTEKHAADPIAHFNLAATLEEMGDSAGATASLRRVVELDPEDALAYGHLGAIYLESGDAVRAEEALRRAAELNPSSAVANSNLGVALKTLGRDRDAAHYFERALKIDPTLTQAGFELDAVRERLSATKSPERGGLAKGLNRTKVKFLEWFRPFTGQDAEAGPDFYDGLYEQLILADAGAELADELVRDLRKRAADEGESRPARIIEILREMLVAILSDTEQIEPFAPGRLNVVMLVGVNGVGKTTVLAKIARYLRERGIGVLIAAADTFRAAAVDQLRIWAERTATPMVSGQQGADPAAVVFDATQAAIARKADVLLIDTAGRLQTKKNLMAELQKIERIIAKNAPDANVHHLLCIDANTGQNAASQVELFKSVCRVRGLIVNKLDGTARGGAILAIVRAHRLPVIFAGVGEGVSDLAEFDANDFVKGWFG